MRYSFLYFTAVKVVENPVRVSNYFSRVQLLFDNRRMMHQPESSAFAWGPEISSTMSAESTTESPFKRRRTTTHRYIEQDLQEAVEMDVKRKGPTRRNQTKTWPNSEPWPCDASWSPQQLSQDTAATLAPLSPGTAASLTMASQHVKVPS